MSDLTSILNSSTRYRQAFEQGLIRILRHQTAGTFILACANLISHPEYQVKHETELQSVFDFLKAHYRKLAQDGQQPKDAPDDMAVIKQLIERGLDNIDPVQTREIHTDRYYFLLNYNPLRGFRPARMSKVTDLCLDTPFNPDGFHFNKPFLEKEIFAQGDIAGRHASLLYNKFPIVPYHALLVLDRHSSRNQYLDTENLQFIIEFQASVQAQNPQFIVAYNSLGAGASVNHLHFHCFLEQSALPIFSSQYSHNGGNLPYPANCQVAKTHVEATAFMRTCHENNIAYNLLIRDGKVFCLPRKFPPETMPGFDIGGFGWSHLAGFFNVDNPDELNRITVDQLVHALQAVSAHLPDQEKSPRFTGSLFV